jgi:hypothetical protein
MFFPDICLEKPKYALSSEGEKNKLKVYEIRTPFYPEYREEIYEVMRSFKGISLNSLPLIESYTRGYKCKLKDIELDKNIINYFLVLESEKICYRNSLPVKVVNSDIVECRHYIDMNMILIYCNASVEAKIILNIISLIMYNAVIKCTPDIRLNYSKPKANEINIDASLSILIVNSMLDRITKIKDEKNIYRLIYMEEIIEIDDINKFKGEVKLLKNGTININLKNELQEKHKLYIKKDGEIVSTILCDKSIIDNLLFLIFINRRFGNYTILLNSIETSLEEYFNFLHANMDITVKTKFSYVLMKELTELIYGIQVAKSKEDLISTIYLTVVFNTLIQINCNKIIENSYCEHVEIIEYENLSNFIRIYMRSKFNMQVTEKDVENSMSILVGLIKESSYNLLEFLKLLKHQSREFEN